jgi:hypothetical protein
MERRIAPKLKSLALLLSLIAVPLALIGALMMWIAWKENSQEEFHGVAGISWDAWLAVGWTWFLGIWVPLAAFAILLWAINLRSARPRSD